MASKRAVLVSVAVAVVVLFGLFGHLNPGHYVVVDRGLNHPIAFGVVALLLVTVGAEQQSWPKLILSLLVGTAVLGGLLGVLLLLASSLEDSKKETLLRAPGDGNLQVLVVEGSNFIDAYWKVSVRTRAGLLSRHWPIGCINGAAGYDYQDARWVGPYTLRIRTDDGQTRSQDITFDPTTGRPNSTISAGGCP